MSSSGGGKLPPTKSESDAKRTSEELKTRQNEELQNLFDQARSFFDKGAPDISKGLGIQQRGVGDLTNAASGFRGASAGFGEAAGRADTITGGAADALSFLTSGDVLKAESNPALQQYIDLSNKSIQSQFTEGVIPSITSGAAAVGGIGSSRQGVAEGIASGKFADAVTRNTADLSNRGYQSGLNAFVQGIGLAPGIAQSQGIGSGFKGVSAEFLKDAANAQFGAGSAQIGIDTAQNDQERDSLAFYQSIVGNKEFGGAVPGRQAEQPRNNKVASAAGAGIAAYGATGNPYIAGAAAIATLL